MQDEGTTHIPPPPGTAGRDKLSESVGRGLKNTGINPSLSLNPLQTEAGCVIEKFYMKHGLQIS